MNAIALDVAEPSAGTSGWLPDGELIVDDLDNSPGDGRRYEVASPSTRRYDRTLKMTTYAQAGALSYWLVEPDPDEPRVTTHELREDGTYCPGPAAAGRETLTVSAPFALSFSPRDLLDDLRP